jgi:hypothetical protein
MWTKGYIQSATLVGSITPKTHEKWEVVQWIEMRTPKAPQSKPEKTPGA